MTSTIRFLTQDSMKSIHHASLDILENTGVKVHNKDALEYLENAGCKISSNVVKIFPDIVNNALETVPSDFRLYSRDGDKSFLVGQDNFIFNPGSSSLNIIDGDRNLSRRAVTKDLVQFSILVDALESIQAQSTALVPSDVDESISDSYRLYIILRNSNKPIITGAFTKQSFLDMVRMLESVVGGSEQLRDKPRAIFDCCPTSPLTWSDITCQNLVDCSKNLIPAEIVPAPQIGATSPITLTGTLIQTNAEFLSGLVISQLVSEGSPIVYGSAPLSFDMQYCTGRVGAIEAMITACAAAEMGKYYQIPTHAYLGLSDSKVIDAQSGFETAIGIVIGALARINIISGPGMLSSLNSFSLEKLIIDEEICGAIHRLLMGVDTDRISTDIEVIKKVASSGEHFIGEKHTRENLMKEHLIPSSVICRLTTETWQNEGCKDILERARVKAHEILETHSGSPLTFEFDNQLDTVFIDILTKYQITQRELPWGL